jgi:8-oxo-dGTP pyrophosphatase MutT (NUDIX family)
MAHIHEKIDFIVSAYIVHGNRVLMIFHGALQKWLPIGGHIELDEDPEQALFREIEEESGLTADQLVMKTSKDGHTSTTSKSLYIPNSLNIHQISETHRHIALTSLTNEVRLADSEHENICWLTIGEIEDLKPHIPDEVVFHASKALAIGMNTGTWDPSLDAVTAAPQSHKILFENDSIRVVEVIVAPHQKEPMHTHQWSSVMIVDRSTRIRYYDATNNGVEYPARDVAPDKPFVEWMEPELTHAVENLDDTIYHAVRVEFKK